jgi:hypothetical protein
VCVCQVLEECQSELYDLKFKQEGKQSAISDEVEILLTGIYRTFLVQKMLGCKSSFVVASVVDPHHLDMDPYADPDST